MTELSPSNSKYKHFTRMLNKNFLRVEWLNRKISQAHLCQRETWDTQPFFWNGLFLQKLYIAAVWKATSERRGASPFFLSPIDRDPKENQKPTSSGSTGTAVRASWAGWPWRSPLERSNSLVGGVPAHGQGVGVRWSLKVPSNLNHSVILHVQPFVFSTTADLFISRLFWF